MCIFVLRPSLFPYRGIRTRALTSACHILCNNRKQRNQKKKKKTLLNSWHLFRFKKLIIHSIVLWKIWSGILWHFRWNHCIQLSYSAICCSTDRAFCLAQGIRQLESNSKEIDFAVFLLTFFFALGNGIILPCL